MVGLIDLVQTLTAPHSIDRYLELVRPTFTLRDMRARITDVCHPVPGSVTVVLRPTRQWRGHLAGQFVRLGVLIDGVKHTRCYSPVNSQARGDRYIELTVKAHPNGLVSQYLYHHAAPGMVVDLAPAAGVFHMPDPRPERVVLISGGSGITPVLSMLRTLADEGHVGEVLFLHYARSPQVVPYRAELETLTQRHTGFRIELRYTRQATGQQTVSDTAAPRACAATAPGRFGYDELERVAPWFAQAQTYVCGPPSLMSAVRTVYEAEQLDARLHTEEFTVSATPADPADAEGKVTFSGSGVTVENTGTTLLEQAESAGLTPEYGCRMGICLSCTAIRRSGCSRDIRTGELDSDPGRPIQLCINAPVGDIDIAI